MKLSKFNKRLLIVSLVMLIVSFSIMTSSTYSLMLEDVFGPDGLAVSIVYAFLSFSELFFILVGLIAMYWVFYEAKSVVWRAVLALCSMILAICSTVLFGMILLIVPPSLEFNSMWLEILIITIGVGVSIFLAGTVTNVAYKRYLQHNKKAKKKTKKKA